MSECIDKVKANVKITDMNVTCLRYIALGEPSLISP
jgi:hypothetical protein